jgi:ubiquitin
MPKKKHKASRTISPDTLPELFQPQPLSREVAHPSIPLEAVLSFLKETKGALTWSTSDLTNSLKISRGDADRTIALLRAQGYVGASDQESKKDRWLTTLSGEIVSGSKNPRFLPDSVKDALDALKKEISRNNMDKSATFKITDAVAFGDFLLKDRSKVQAADVGLALAPRKAVAETDSVPYAQAERVFLSELRKKSNRLNIRTYANWMSKRTHLNLLGKN